MLAKVNPSTVSQTSSAHPRAHCHLPFTQSNVVLVPWDKQGPSKVPTRVLLQKPDFVVGTGASEDLIPARKAAEAGDDIAVGFCKTDTALHELSGLTVRLTPCQQRLDQRDTRDLADEPLFVHQRQVEEQGLEVADLAVELACDTCRRESGGFGVGGVRLVAAPVHVARILVEEEEERETASGTPALGRRRPGVEFVVACPRDQCAERVADERVVLLRVRRGEPVLWRAVEPERKRAVDVRLHGV